MAKVLPKLGDTERIALEAGTVWWDGDLFSGRPDWNKLLEFQVPPIPADAHGVCLAESGRPQWLTGRYRTAALREVASTIPDGVRDAAMRTLLGALRIAFVTAHRFAAAAREIRNASVCWYCVRASMRCGKLPRLRS